MAYRAAVVGGSGYTGAELLRLLAGHPEIEVVHVTAEANAGKAVTELYPSLARAYPGVTYEAFEPGSVEGADVVFLGLPHGESQRLVPELVDRVGHVVDLAADFRLPAAAYEQWYGDPHGAPELLDRFAFGMPELFRDEITPETHVAAPGCYPTAAALALAPLLATGMVEPTGIVVDAASGVSGRGRGLSAPSLFSEANENVAAYGLLTHRHTGEIEHALAHVYGAAVQVLFTPHLVPMTRGILATCYARPATAGLTSARLLDTYADYYNGEPFVIVGETPPATKATLGSNTCHVTVRYDDRTGTVLALGAIDNLVKGASGQAIQAANLVLGLPEAMGLPVTGLVP
ncbi:MAG TPA: N-acetyl-gamma-glutamyl-phosphate reductase [Acidimicrobiia bacterium]|nr:N-acetyl-gamma-glutamyl-phosphate reductase [Acidimicrobiia bacterium]